jgi:hypothetical protein
MKEYAYTKVSGKLKEFLEKVRTVGVPPNVTMKWLGTIGYKSSNDRKILSVIRQIGFIDDTNNPTEKWKKFRGANYKKVLAEGIREGYSELYEIYPDAQNCGNDDLESFFTSNSSSGKQVINATINTFKVLCGLADFSSTVIAGTKSTAKIGVPVSLEANVPNGHTKEMGQDFTPKLHIDIQIHISPDTTPQKIEQIFKSMAKHIYRIKE